MRAIIPTGGRGTRMQPLTFSTNKHFIPVGNRPLIFYAIESVADAGIKEILVTYNFGKYEEAFAVLGDGRKWGLKFKYVLQEKPLGLANIFAVCEKDLEGDDFVLHLGDNIFSEGINPLVDHFLKAKPYGLVAKVIHDDNSRLGVPVFDKEGRLKDYVEKPKHPPNRYAIPGIYFFKNYIFNCFKGSDSVKPSQRGEYEIVDPYRWLIARGKRVDVIDYVGRWLDPGKFDDWIEANQYLLDKKLKEPINEGKVDKASRLEGRIEIKKSARIINSEIRGPVSIGCDCLIKNCYIGPYTSISDNCSLTNIHLENSVVMNGVTLKNINQPIDESLIGTDSKIVKENGPASYLKMFVGEKSKISL